MTDSSYLHFFTGYSLVDITATGVTRGAAVDSRERSQQRNWETVLQCIGLRTQPHNIVAPTCIETDLDLLEFGDFYQGQHRVWTWHWTVESLGVYDLPNRHLGGLQQDFEQVPVVTYLDETARFMLPIFYPYGTIKNIYIKQRS
jgi:hypothetical protein